jgi:hypothetical protein
MGRPNRQQHKVPRCYLEAFTDKNGTLWEADCHYNLRPNKPASVLTERDYYTVHFPDGKGGTLYIEKDVLGNIETAYADIYVRVLKPRKPLNLHDKAVLSLFIASMMERVPARREAWEDLFSQLRKFNEFAKDVTPEQAARYSTPMPQNANSIPLSEALKAGEDVGSKVSFITSDCPCVLHNPNLPEKSIYQSGLIQKKVELTIPFSPTLALLCGWDLEEDSLYLPVPQRMIHTINKRTMTYATNLICDSKDFLAEYIRLEKVARGIDS